MIRILTNLSLVWMLSLLVYELVLRRLTFHRPNRFYLLATLVAGIVLPLLPWGNSVQVTVISDTSNIQPAGAQAVALLPFQKPLHFMGNASYYNINWVLIAYLAGVTVAVCLLLRDVLKILRLYRRAKISREGRWLIAETGAAHGPFSFLRIIFLSSKDDYTEEQWQMVTVHERQHYLSAHFLDLALMQAAVIAFWFHPLVYIYRYRIRLLHEFEVDSRRDCDAITYGNFLIEHAIAGQSPAFTHSFFLSPLKNRIGMMTRKVSGPAKRLCFLLLIPLGSCFLWCCSQNREHITVDIKGRYAMDHNARLAYPKLPEAFTVLQKNTGNEENKIVISMDPRPVKVDSQTIVDRKDLSTVPGCISPGAEFGLKYLLRHSGADEILKKMPDGEYHMMISDIIVNPAGAINYYMLTFPENWKELTADPSGINILKSNGLTDEDKNAIQQKVAAVAIGGDIEFTVPRNKQGRPVPTFLKWEDESWHSRLEAVFQVRDHSLIYLN